MRRGDEIRFFKWNGATHDVFRALVRNRNPGAHTAVGLSYYNDTPLNQNNVLNIEQFGNESNLSGNDYWIHAKRAGQDPYDSMPFTANRPRLGKVVWLFQYDATDNECYARAAIVQGMSAGQSPKVRGFYIGNTGSRVNFPNTRPHDGDWTSDFWVNRKLTKGAY